MTDELEKPFITIGGDGGVYRLTWAFDGSVREISDGQPQFWMLAYLLDNIHGDGEVADLDLVKILRYQAQELENQAIEAAKRVPSFRIEVGSLSPTARAEIEEFLTSKDFTYNLQEESE